jgi:GntR family transcriptional regulator, transcriptional repressor for pyruvate dehydrogenase complex
MAVRTKSNGKLAVAPIERVDLVSEVVIRIRDEILAGRISAGEELPAEAEMVARFGVSRTVIREAMRTLRAQGFVEISRGRMPRVRPADAQHAVESLGFLLARNNQAPLSLLEVRRPLETEVAALAAQRATIEHLAKLADNLRRIGESTSLNERIKLDLEFHETLAVATGNPIFPLLFRVLADLLQNSLRKTHRSVGIERTVVGHRAVLKAVESRDPESARSAMSKHIREAEEVLKGIE